MDRTLKHFRLGTAKMKLTAMLSAYTRVERYEDGQRTKFKALCLSHRITVRLCNHSPVAYILESALKTR